MFIYTEEKSLQKNRYSNCFYQSIGFQETIRSVYIRHLWTHQLYLLFGMMKKLVGLTRVLDDTEMLAQIHYVLVHPDYQGKGIAGKMIEYVKEKYKDFMYIEGMPEDKNNVPFYTEHGFSVMENGAAIQICNYKNWDVFEKVIPFKQQVEILNGEMYEDISIVKCK